MIMLIVCAYKNFFLIVRGVEIVIFFWIGKCNSIYIQIGDRVYKCPYMSNGKPAANNNLWWITKSSTSTSEYAVDWDAIFD